MLKFTFDYADLFATEGIEGIDDIEGIEGFDALIHIKNLPYKCAFVGNITILRVLDNSYLIGFNLLRFDGGILDEIIFEPLKNDGSEDRNVLFLEEGKLYWYPISIV